MKKHLSYWFLNSLVILLCACQDIQIQSPPPEPAKPEATVEPVPPNLLATDSCDSLFTLSEPIDFSVVNRAGQGPCGSLIRWGAIESPGFWRSFTYDSGGRLLGLFQNEYTSSTVELARYQGTYLAESFVQGLYANGDVDRIYYVKRYKYNAQGRLSQTLIYMSSNDQPNRFQLYTWLLHEYNAQGQLQKQRMQSISPEGLYQVYHWQKGDCVRREQYQVVGYGKPDELREQATISFGTQTDPLSALPLYDPYTTQPSKHYATGSIAYEVRDGVAKPFPGCVINSAFEYDRQGRLSRMRYNTGNVWDYFTYAP